VAENRIEGEGSYSGTHAYNKDTEDFIDSGKVDKAAADAAKAVGGAEGDELARAEESGKRHSHGEDPALHEKAEQKKAGA
jgi:hypothetical protein